MTVQQQKNPYTLKPSNTAHMRAGAVHGTAWELEEVRGNSVKTMLTLAAISTVASLQVTLKPKCRKSARRRGARHGLGAGGGARQQREDDADAGGHLHCRLAAGLRQGPPHLLARVRLGWVQGSGFRASTSGVSPPGVRCRCRPCTAPLSGAILGSFPTET